MGWETNSKSRIRVMKLPHGWLVDVVGGGTCFVPHPVRVTEEEEVTAIKEVAECLSK